MEKKVSYTIILLLGLFLTLFSPSTVANANQQLDIETFPDNYLFDLSNMKPGDRASRILTIQNRGEQDFTYTSDAKLKGGSEKLYDEYLLMVSDSEGLLYEGKLKDFADLSSRFLKSMNEEDLLFVMEFPYELGNEFQGLAFEFELRFIIEDYESGNPGNPGDPNEPTDPSDTGDQDDTDDPNVPEDQNQPGIISDSDEDSGGQGEPSSPEDLGDQKDSNNPNESGEPNKPTEPEHSSSPDSSDKTEVPDKTDDADNNSKNQDEDTTTIKPQHPIAPGVLASAPVDGQIMPSTATNIFNYILVGFLLISGGVIAIVLKRKRRVKAI